MPARRRAPGRGCSWASSSSRTATLKGAVTYLKGLADKLSSGPNASAVRGLLATPMLKSKSLPMRQPSTSGRRG